MEVLPTIKVYQIDYEFIIKNYLDKSLWKKTWTLFNFKDNIFTLNLSKINTKDEKIYFEVRFNKLNNQWKYNNFEEVVFDLNNMTIKLLKQSINGAIFRLAEKLDMAEIEKSSIYQKIYDYAYREEQYLKELAEEFLDSEGVSNSEIREIYIDNYIQENSTIDDRLSECRNYYKYNFESELLLIICETIKDENRKFSILSNLNNDNNIDKLTKEIKEYMKYIETDDWLEEMRSNLVSI